MGCKEVGCLIRGSKFNECFILFIIRRTQAAARDELLILLRANTRALAERGLTETATMLWGAMS